MLKLFTFFLLSAPLIGQTWFPYVQGIPCPGTVQCPYPAVGIVPIEDMPAHTSVQIRCSARNLQPGFSGDLVGEFWTVVDINTGTNPYDPGFPYLYSNVYTLDGDIFFGPQGTIIWLTPFTLAPYSGADYVLNPMPSQAGGTAFQLDIATVSVVDIPIAEINWSPCYIGMTVTFQFHLIGNMNHEFDGSGWMYATTTITFQI